MINKRSWIPEKWVFLALTAIFTQNKKNVIVSASRFSIDGPLLTLTLKDPRSDVRHKNTLNDSSGYASYFPSNDQIQINDDDLSDSKIIKSKSTSSFVDRIIDLSGLSPSVTWGIRSMGRPLPNWIPFIKSISLNSHYQYENQLSATKNNLMTSTSNGNYVEGHLNIGSKNSADWMVHLNPIYYFQEKKANFLVGLSTNGESLENTKTSGAGTGFFGLLRFTSKGGKLLEYVRATYKTNLPFTTLSSFTVAPAFDFSTSSPTCLVEGESGTGRTKAILDLNWDDSTLGVIHALNSYNTIAPVISLHSAKIMYHWDVALSSGRGNIRTKVDPTSAIEVIWTDITEGGKWVTDLKLPLDGGIKKGGNGGGNIVGRSIFAADIRVRRQFQF